jgi:ABC-type Zn2+ transport system substrate-binding protein/surface adhesin
MGKRQSAAVLALLLAATAAGCAATPDRAVLATVYPLYVALDNVAGDVGLSRGVLSAGVGGVLQDSDRAALSGYTAVLIASGSAENYLDDVRSSCPELSVVTVDDGLAEGASCPWTSVRAHMEEVRRIADALSAWDPGNADTYRANADAYLATLSELDALYGRMLTNVAGQRVALFRDTFKPLSPPTGWRWPMSCPMRRRPSRPASGWPASQKYTRTGRCDCWWWTRAPIRQPPRPYRPRPAFRSWRWIR